MHLGIVTDADVQRGIATLSQSLPDFANLPYLHKLHLCRYAIQTLWRRQDMRRQPDGPLEEHSCVIQESQRSGYRAQLILVRGYIQFSLWDRDGRCLDWDGFVCLRNAPISRI